MQLKHQPLNDLAKPDSESGKTIGQFRGIHSFYGLKVLGILFIEALNSCSMKHLHEVVNSDEQA